ncbi:STAS domain-containing protein [Occallatibacter riparius]|uniref:STAS domain-containing protein n=1 Tax=Occallatibacter riparius TaxID=1002689 RepID=A0A9J7BL16_9BACT|nr:STAS domain-containing protein [Occallatibacter riparius]UWZ82458.1 STAS domain-containing protein [Occallatibacter riparius]
MPDEVEVETCAKPPEARSEEPLVLSRSGDACLIRLTGTIDIGMAAELKSMLMAGFENARSIRILFERVSDLDVTALALLWAARRKAEQKNVKFGFSGEIPKALRDAVEDLGMEGLRLFD